MANNTLTNIGIGVGGGGALALPGVRKAVGGLFGGNNQPIDITAQLNAIQQNYAKQNSLNTELGTKLNPLTDQYKTDLASAISGAKNDQNTTNNQYLAETGTNTKEAQDALRKNLYSKTFSGVPESLQAIREASAAGGGLNTGSYQKAVGEFGGQLAETLGRGETQLQAQGVQNRQSAQENAFNTFSNLSSHLSDQQISGLTKVMDTGREDLVRQYTNSMGFSEDETNAIVGLLNFQQSGQLASNTADNANKTALLTALIGGGAKITGGGK